MNKVEAKDGCKVCEKEVSAGRTVYCSDDCELLDLRRKSQLREQKFQEAQESQEPLKCLGRVQWSTCAQEWYLKDSYDAKRRACELRKMGFIVEAKSIGEIPIRRKGLAKLARVTILTAWSEDASVLPPPPPRLVDGFQVKKSPKV